MKRMTGREIFQRYLSRRLTAARYRLALHGVLGVLAAVGAVVLLAAWVLGGLTWVDTRVKAGLTLTCLAVLVTVAFRWLVLPLGRMRKQADLCRELEQDRSFANVLVAAEEACRRPERWEEASWVSSELVRRLFARAVQIAQEIRPGRLLALPWATRVLLGAAVVTGLLALALAPGAERMNRGLQRLGQPWQDETYRPVSGLFLAHGPEVLVAGSDALLLARDFGTPQGEVFCEVRTGTGLWRALPAVQDSLGGQRPYHVWRAELNDVHESFAYRFRRDGMVTDSLAVKVLHPPLLTILAGRVIPPEYTRLPPQHMTRLPSYLEVLAGSQLEWLGTVSHPVKHAAAVTAAGDTIALQIRQNRLAGLVQVDSTFSYAIYLEDEHGLTNSSRVQFTVAAAQDLQPVVQLQRYEDDGKLPMSGDVVLFAEAADDFGLSQVELLCRRENAEHGVAQGGSGEEAGWRRVSVWQSSPTGVAPGLVARQLELDTGFGSLAVTVTPTDSTRSRLLMTRDLQLDAGNLDLVPGDVLAVCIEVTDNKRPGEPGRARSRIVRMVLPSAAEILTAQVSEGKDRLDDLEEIRRRSQSLSEDLKRLDRELKKDPLPDWARQQEMEAALNRQRALQNELTELANELQADLEALAENQLTSIELMEKMDQIAQLLEQVHNEELENLLAQLKEAVSKLSPEEIAEAIAEVAKNQQEMVRRLDRALEMLKELAREQELEGMTSLLAQLIRKQQELLEANRQAEQATDRTATADSLDSGDQPSERKAEEQTAADEAEDREGAEGEGEQAAGEQQQGEEVSDEELARRQEALAQELEQLVERLREALENLQQDQAGKEQTGQQSPSAEELQKALEQALEQLAQQQPSESMQDAAAELEQGNRDQAAQQQQQALRDLGALYHVLIAGQEAMQMAMQQFEVASLRRLAADLLALSVKEEEIAAVIPNDLRNLRSIDLTRSQFRILKAARSVRDQLQSMSVSNPMQTLRILQKLDDLLAELDRSVEALEAGRGALARRSARQSLGQTNEIIISLLTQAHMQSGGSGGCPMPSMSEQLRQMAREQAGLNGLAEQLRQQMQQGGLSQEQRAQMERLQADQQGLADSARDFAEQESGLHEGERILGDMEHMAAEMEKVVQDFDEGVIDNETLARQEKILSRLLDAHNSVRKRDFNNRRESRTAAEIFDPRQEGSLAPDDGKQAPFRLRYQPVEKAPLEYRDLVRRYFRAVEQWHLPDLRRGTETPETGGLP
jgi:hypothetical protein